VVELLLASLNVDCSHKYEGRTLHSLAAGGGRLEIVQLLLEKDDSLLNSKDDGGLTPLSREAERGSVPVVQMLLAIDGVETNMADNDGRTALWCVAYIMNKVSIALLSCCLPECNCSLAI
jgi:ankyrin repeat protein